MNENLRKEKTVKMKRTKMRRRRRGTKVNVKKWREEMATLLMIS